MKHPVSRAVHAAWDASRAGARAPYRSALQPSAIRELLGDIFVLGCDSGSDYPLRVAGTRVCALFGADQKSNSFPCLFEASSRNDLVEILGIVTEELQVCVAGVNAIASDGSDAALELVLLPFRSRAHAPLSLTGALVPMTAGPLPLRELALTSWRYLEQPREPLRRRALRKLALARGLMVYEGLR